MSKMTREQRLAAGWVECWGRFDWEEGRWWRKSDNGVPYWGVATVVGGRVAFMGFRDAAFGIDPQTAFTITARRFWRRRKPKAPPPLRVGDVAKVIGTVMRVRADGVVSVHVGHSGEWALDPRDIVR